MPNNIQDFKSEGQDAEKQFYNKMRGVMPQSGIKAIYSLRQGSQQKPTNGVNNASVARGFNPQVQPPTQRNVVSNARVVTNKPMWRNVVSQNIYSSQFENGATQFKEQFTVVPVAGRNEGFLTSVDKRFWQYAGVVDGGNSHVKQANSYSKTTLSNVLGNMITNAGNNPASINAINKASGKWK